MSEKSFMAWMVFDSWGVPVPETFSVISCDTAIHKFVTGKAAFDKEKYWSKKKKEGYVAKSVKITYQK